jgi:hypothetical protein
MRRAGATPRSPAAHMLACILQRLDVLQPLLLLQAAPRCCPHQDRLALELLAHLPVRCISDCIHVGRQVTQVHPPVLVHHVWTIQMCQVCKGVDSDQNAPCVGVDVIIYITVFDVPEHTGLMQVRQPSHILQSTNAARMHRHSTSSTNAAAPATRCFVLALS